MTTLRERINAVDTGTTAYILLNVASSIGIVFSNKVVFKTFAWNFGTALTFVHFVITFLGLFACERAGVFQRKEISIRAILPMCFAFCGFVVLNNLSLLYNSVGFYQICKVLTTPVIMVIQTCFYHTSFPARIKLSLIPVLLGVLIATVTDVEVNFVGTVYALSAVVVTSMYQIWSGTKQKELQVNSMQLLLYQSPISAVMLLFLIPVFDNVGALVKYTYTSTAISAILFSAVLAFFVNLSIFLVIARTSPVTYNVVGHFKLTLIILGGWFFFDATLDYRNMFGVALTLVGVFIYTHFKMEDQANEAKAKAALAAEPSSRV
eukprot:TRINITY_DN6236_c0_g1_i1.p1 TRINITY_DN6236_c0_g1~~TRINITY_DN6236_c0_g1_i1.p1  ORF type:complete len:328 (+),score=64.42 TRINITY_DN6236_c0_g1_i1:24-986(+)